MESLSWIVVFSSIILLYEDSLHAVFRRLEKRNNLLSSVLEPQR